MEGFPSNLNDTFTSTRGCAEPMLPMCQLKVKVTVKCQIFNKQILDIMSCPLYNSFTNGRFPSNLNDVFTSTRGGAEPMLPMCQLDQGQGHNKMSNKPKQNLYTPKNFIEC